MSPALALSRRPVAAALQLFFWLHPEWWSLSICAFAWALMLLGGWRHSGHDSQYRMAFVQELPNWMLMATAMMLPLVMDAVRATAVCSLWTRRHRAMAEFLAGYFAPWLVMGILVAWLREAAWSHTYTAAALGFVVAALWQRTPMHRRALIACHRRLPLAPLGWRADRDCIRFGAAIGVACVCTCWPLMLACAFAEHNPIAMAGAMVVGAAERWWFRPRTRAMLLGTLAIASYYVVVAAFQGYAGASPQPPSPEMVGVTKVPFYLRNGTTQICLPMRASTHGHTTPARVFLNIESMTSHTWSAPYEVYLNLPPKERPEQHPELNAGELSMFGLVEASRSNGKHPPKGLYEHLEVTDLYNRLAATPGWDASKLCLSFVPRNPSSTAKVRVGGISLYVTWPAQ